MPDEKRFCVYRHTAPNGKVYIGITCQNPVRRWAGGHGYRHNSHFYRAIQSYGWDTFSHEILYSDLTKEDACAKEIELIQYHKSNDERWGYNLSSGGEFPMTGRSHTDEARRKMSEATRGARATWYGKKLSLEHRRRMSQSHVGKTVWNDEQRKQISERQKGEKNHRYGVKASAETKKKQSESHRKYTIVQLSADGVVINTYPTTAAAAKALGCSKTTISNACCGARPQALGYKWKYVAILKEE